MAITPLSRGPERDAALDVLGSLLSDGRQPNELASGEWLSLIERAREERVAPLLLERLRGRGWPEALPSEAESSLRRELYNTSAANLLHYRALAKALSTYATRHRAERIRAVVLKGAALATSLYRDIALRPMGDVDLLVPREELTDWEELLRDLGYERFTPEMLPGLDRHLHYQIAFRDNRDTGVVIELHWSLIGGDADARQPEMEWFWAETEPFETGTRGASVLGEIPRVLRLTPTAQLLYASAHAMLQHGAAQSPLIWLVDIHRTVQQSGSRIDWRELHQRAASFGWDGALAEALGRSRALFGTKISSESQVHIEPAPGRQHEAHLLSKRDPRTSRAEAVWREILCLHWRGRLELVLAILFPSPSYMRWRYPRSGALWPVTYLYRWGVVIGEAATGLVDKCRFI